MEKQNPQNLIIYEQIDNEMSKRLKYVQGLDEENRAHIRYQRCVYQGHQAKKHCRHQNAQSHTRLGYTYL